MAKTFDASLPTDRDTVRLKAGDTDTTAMFLQDETIDALLVANSDSIGLTAIACVNYIITQLSRPDYRVDWLSVSQQAAAADSYRAVRRQLEQEFGVGAGRVSSTSSYPTRYDSYPEAQ